MRKPPTQEQYARWKAHDRNKYANNPEHRAKLLAHNREYSRLNRERIYAKRKERIANNPNFKLGLLLRQRLAYALHGRRKGASAIKDCGCTIDELRAHIERQFLPGMSWENWSKYGWHIDHIRPLSSFDLTDPDQAKTACHYTNLRPLWWRDNMSKGARIETPVASGG